MIKLPIGQKAVFAPVFLVAIVQTFAFCGWFGSGILNTQTNVLSETEKAKTALKEKKEEANEEIEKYRAAIEADNKKIKASIKQMKMVIEIKKNTLAELEAYLRHSKNNKETTR